MKNKNTTPKKKGKSEQVKTSKKTEAKKTVKPVEEIKEVIEEVPDFTEDEKIQDLEEKIGETSAAANNLPEEEVYPKGTEIEDQIKKIRGMEDKTMLDELKEEKEKEDESPEDNEEPEEKENPEPEKKNKKGAGRPPGSGKKKVTPAKSDPEEAAVIRHKVDIISRAVNAALMPAVAHVFSKDRRDLKLTDVQRAELLEVMPDTDFNKPSWPGYITLSMCHIMSNFWEAKSTKAQDHLAELLSKLSPFQAERLTAQLEIIVSQGHDPKTPEEKAKMDKEEKESKIEDAEEI